MVRDLFGAPILSGGRQKLYALAVASAVAVGLFAAVSRRAGHISDISDQVESNRALFDEAAHKAAGGDNIMSPLERGKFLRALDLITPQAEVSEQVLFNFESEKPDIVISHLDGRYIGTTTTQILSAYVRGY